uniref:Uncharacterized protein n=1 Tax=Glossina pallidipes TaxID=7398 RepID=A0A1B0AGF0_GLOPL
MNVNNDDVDAIMVMVSVGDSDYAVVDDSSFLLTILLALKEGGNILSSESRQSLQSVHIINVDNREILKSSKGYFVGFVSVPPPFASLFLNIKKWALTVKNR